jgi:hypothetical protein
MSKSNRICRFLVRLRALEGLRVCVACVFGRVYSASFRVTRVTLRLFLLS